MKCCILKHNFWTQGRLWRQHTQTSIFFSFLAFWNSNSSPIRLSGTCSGKKKEERGADTYFSNKKEGQRFFYATNLWKFHFSKKGWVWTKIKKGAKSFFEKRNKGRRLFSDKFFPKPGPCTQYIFDLFLFTIGAYKKACMKQLYHVKSKKL